MLLSVYDPKGEMVEVQPDLAKKLVIEDGWSLEPPSVVAPAAEAAPAPLEIVGLPTPTVIPMIVESAPMPGPGPL